MKKLTLLQNFIEGKLAAHSEPRRKGKPKGEPIGFTTAKYAVSLYSLYDIYGAKGGLKALAKKSGVSYGVIRKWRTELSFTKLVKKHCREFARVFVHRIEERAQLGVNPLEQYIKSTPKPKLKNPKPPSVTYEEFLDVRLYSLQLWVAIEKERKKVQRDLAFSAEALTVLRLAKPAGKPPEILALERLAKKRLSLSMLDKVINILQKPKHTEDEKKTALYSLGLLRRSFQEED